MQNWYKHLLAGVWMLLPLVVLGWRRRGWSNRDLVVRALVAAGVCWLWLLLSSVAVTEIDLALAARSEEVARGEFGDRGRHAGALMFGWVPSVALALVWWGVFQGIRALGTARDS